MDARTIIISILLLVIAVVFMLRLRYFSRYSKMKKEMQAEMELFLTTFDPSKFIDFEVLDFRAGTFSHIGPFPSKHDGEWRFTVYLVKADFEDVGTITHEITEFTVGRIIERLLQLRKPLYLLRRQTDKFWISGKQQKYLIEHVLATFSELENINVEKLGERIAAEDVEKWHLLDSK